MTSIKRIAVAGGTGRLGKYIVASLLDAQFEATVLSRLGSTSDLPSSTAATEVDYTSESSLTFVLKGHDALVCCINSNAVVIQPTLFSAAVAAGVKRIIPSEYGIVQVQPKAKDLPPIQPVVELQKLLISTCESNPQVSYTVLATGVFLDIAINTSVVLNWDQHSVDLCDGGAQPLSSTRLSSIGKAVAGIMRAPEDYKNQVVRIHDVIITQNKWLDIAKQANLSAKWAVQDIDTKKVIDEGLAELQASSGSDEDILSAATMKVMVVVPFSREYEMRFRDDQVANRALGIEMMPQGELEELLTQRAKGQSYEEGEARMF